jgi:hypothetical protein
VIELRGEITRMAGGSPKIEIPEGSIIFVGNFGSGKTEVAVNFARHVRRLGESPVHLIDLDVVNPYFRSREAIDILTEEGISVVAPKGDKFYADLPIIVPEVRSLLQSSKGRVILDVGGDDLGATVLASLRDAIPDGSYELWIVLNARRPFTDTVEGSVRMVRQIEHASKLKATGLVANTHLLHETTSKIVEDGFRMTKEVASKISLPIRFVAVQEKIIQSVAEKSLGVPLLPLHLTMRRPWEKEELGGLTGA